MEIDLKTFQSQLLKMIKYVDKSLKKQNIPYFLLGGSVLGAVRHKGFIPWDDDIDIGIFRSDFQKVEIYLTNNLPESWVYEPIDNHIIPDAPIGKIRNIIYPDLPLKEQPTIDVFALDYAPNTLKLQKRQVLYGNIYHLFIYGLPSKNRGVINMMITKGLLYCIRGKVRDKVVRYTFNLMTQWKKENSNFITNLFGYPNRKELMPASFFDKATYVDFEDTQLVIPDEYHSYLTRIYGDYLILPPIEQRQPLHKSIKYKGSE